MDFEIGILLIIGYLLSFSKSQARFHVYYSTPGQQSFYCLSGDRWTEFFKARHTTYPPYTYSQDAFWYPNYQFNQHNIPKPKTISKNVGRDIIVHQKNYSVQYGPPVEQNLSHLKNINLDLNYKINDNEIDNFRHKDFIKYSSAIYFEEYPHLKSLLKHQKTRRDNKLPPLKLKSLRLNSPYVRI